MGMVRDRQADSKVLTEKRPQSLIPKLMIRYCTRVEGLLLPPEGVFEMICFFLAKLIAWLRWKHLCFLQHTALGDGGLLPERSQVLLHIVPMAIRAEPRDVLFIGNKVATEEICAVVALPDKLVWYAVTVGAVMMTVVLTHNDKDAHGSFGGLDSGVSIVRKGDVSSNLLS